MRRGRARRPGAVLIDCHGQQLPVLLAWNSKKLESNYMNSSSFAETWAYRANVIQTWKIWKLQSAAHFTVVAVTGTGESQGTAFGTNGEGM